MVSRSSWWWWLLSSLSPLCCCLVAVGLLCGVLVMAVLLGCVRVVVAAAVRSVDGCWRFMGCGRFTGSFMGIFQRGFDGAGISGVSHGRGIDAGDEEEDHIDAVILRFAGLHAVAGVGYAGAPVNHGAMVGRVIYRGLASGVL